MASWQGESAEVKALLESQALILRGGIKQTIARERITASAVRGDTLKLTVDGSPLVLQLGIAEAQKWLAALAKAPPTLAEKLGVAAGSKVFVLGRIDDDALQAALEGRTTTKLAEATLLLALLRSDADLQAACEKAKSSPGLALWCVYGKGAHVTVKDSVIRELLRAQGYVDDKTCAVSERLTATRYGRRAAS